MTTTEEKTIEAKTTYQEAGEHFTLIGERRRTTLRSGASLVQHWDDWLLTIDHGEWNNEAEEVGHSKLILSPHYIDELIAALQRAQQHFEAMRSHH